MRCRPTNMHMTWEFCVSNRVPVGPLDFKQGFYLYLELGGVTYGLFDWRTTYLSLEMKVLVTSRS